MIRAVIIFLSVLATSSLLLIGCVQQGAPTATPTRQAEPTPTVISTPTVAATAVASPLPQETPRPTFFLRVTSPQHEAIVNTATIEVSGDTTVDAAVSVNGQFVEVDASGRFKATVTLTLGVNTIDVVGSDFTGRRVSAEVVTVLYIPG